MAFANNIVLVLEVVLTLTVYLGWGWQLPPFQGQPGIALLNLQYAAVLLQST